MRLRQRGFERCPPQQRALHARRILGDTGECDAVAHEKDIDAVIPPPAKGPMGYREAVLQALKQEGNAAEGRHRILQFTSAKGTLNQA